MVWTKIQRLFFPSWTINYTHIDYWIIDLCVFFNLKNVFPSSRPPFPWQLQFVLHIYGHPISFTVCSDCLGSSTLAFSVFSWHNVILPSTRHYYTMLTDKNPTCWYEGQSRAQWGHSLPAVTGEWMENIYNNVPRKAEKKGLLNNPKRNPKAIKEKWIHLTI